MLHATAGLDGYAVPDRPSAGWFEERARAFEALHKGVAVRVEIHPSQASLEQALAAAEADLAFGPPLPALSERLLDLGPRLTAELLNDLRAGAREGFGKGGALLGLPTLVEAQFLALNADAFAAAGVALPAAGRWSRAEFEQSLRTLSAEGRHALGFHYLPGHYEWLPLAGPLFDATGQLQPSAAADLARLQEYRRQGWLHPDTAKLPPEQTWALFAQRSAAFAIMPVSTWAIPLLRAEPYKVNLAVAGFPDGLTVGRVYGFSVFAGSGDSARRRAALDLALFMSSPDQQVRLARETGLLPALTGAPNPFEGDPHLVRATELAAGLRPLPAQSVLETLHPQLGREIHIVLVGGKSPADALTAASTPAPR